MKPRRVVVDTHILLSAFLVGGNPRTLFEAARAGKIRLITSPTILAEFASILKREFSWADDDVREELRAFAREKLAPYKVPKVIEIVEAMPLTAVGKVDKKALRV